jgi:NAD+ synthase
MIPLINTQKETKRITDFIQTTLHKNHIQNVVIGVSGGLDSATSLYLLAKSIPLKNIYPMHLYYFDSSIKQCEKIIEETKIPKQNIQIVSIKKIVDDIWTCHCEDPDGIPPSGDEAISLDKRVRFGNVMSRIRMMILFDFAKSISGLVCGTENKTEKLLGYFTRFGDAASDIEPIQHLYKTQIYDLARYLNIPEDIIGQTPTAGLWHGQTDEWEFGFTYKEADEVLYLFYEKKISLQNIVKQEFKNAEKIINFSKKNSFKNKVPYAIY